MQARCQQPRWPARDVPQGDGALCAFLGGASTTGGIWTARLGWPSCRIGCGKWLGTRAPPERQPRLQEHFAGQAIPPERPSNGVPQPSGGSGSCSYGTPGPSENLGFK